MSILIKMERFGTNMKRKVYLWIVYFALVCTAVLGGCSCSKDKNNPNSIVTTPLSLSITNKENVDNCYFVEGNAFAYIGSTIKLDYQIAPSTSQSNEVNVYLTGTTSAATVATTTSNGVLGSVILTTLDKGVVTVTIETKSSPIRSDHFTFEVVDPTTLSRPTMLRFEEGYLIWNKVDDAKSYDLIISDNGVENHPIEVTYDTSYPNGVRYQLPTGTILTGHEYTAKVKANGNGTTTADSEYSDSCYFTTLDKVTRLNQEEGVLRFDTVARATAYELEIEYEDAFGTYEDKVTIEQAEQGQVTYNLSQAYPNVISYHVRVKAIHPSSDYQFVYLDSEWSNVLDIVQLDQVTTFAINNSHHASIITWNAIENALGYKVIISNRSGQVVSSVTVEDNAYMVEENLASGQYQLIVWAVGGDDAIDGQASATFTFTKLDSIQVSSVKLTGNLLSFASVTGAMSYEITYENETDCFTDVVSGNSSVAGEKIEKPGIYHIGIRVIAKGDTGLNLVSSNKIEFPNLVVEKLPNAVIQSVSNYGTKTSIEGDQEVIEVIRNWVSPTLRFEEVPHATSYTIYLAKEGQSPVTVAVISDRLTYEFTDLKPGNYTAWVQANGINNILSSTVVFESSHQDAFAFTVLDKVQQDSIRLDDQTKRIHFDAVEGTSGYLVQENGANDYYFIGNTTSYAPKHAVEGTNIFTLYAWGNGNHYVMSEGTSYVIEKGYTPSQFECREGIIVITPSHQSGELSNAVYEIEVSVAGHVTQIVKSNDSQIDLGSILQPNTTYSLRARITQTGKLHSDYSSSLDVRVLSMSTVQASQQEDRISLTWDQVPNAAGYEVVIQKDEQIVEQAYVTTSTYLTTSVSQEGKYTASIRAIGTSALSGLGYLTSCTSATCDFYRLPCPQVSMNNGKLTWTSGDFSNEVKASGYLLTFSNGQTKVVDSLTYLADFEAGEYSVTVQALGNGQTIMSSAISSSFRFTKLAQPTLSLHNGVLTIVDEGAAKGAKGTIYSLYQAITTSEGTNYVLVKDNITSTDTNLGQYLTQGLRYHLVVRVSHNDYMSSNYDISSSKEVEKLAMSTRFVITDSIFHWQAVSHATAYTIQASQGMSYTKQFAHDILQSPLPELEKTGAYVFGLVAVGDNTEFVSSEEVSVETYQLPQVSSMTTTNGKLAYTYQDKTQPVRFELTIRQNEEEFVINNHRLLTFAFKDEDTKTYQGTYLVSVQAIGDGSSTQSSKSSEIYQVTKLETPNSVAIGVTSSLEGMIRGQLQWPKPYGASDHLQYALLLNGQERILVECSGMNDYETADRVGYFFYEKEGYYYFTGDNILQSGVENYVALRCFDHVSNGYIDSEYTLTASIMGLTAPKNLRVQLSDENSQATLTWDSVEGATKYAIYQVLHTDPTTGMSMLNLRTDLGDNGRVTTNSCVIDNTDQESETHSLVVLAIGTNGKLIEEGNTYWTSSISSILSYSTLGQITGVKVEQGTISWDRGDASKFKLSVYAYVEGIEETYLTTTPIKSFMLTDNAYALEDMQGGEKYFVAIYPVGNSTTTIANHIASTIVVKKMANLAHPKVVEGVLTWELPYEKINTLFNYVDIDGVEKPFDMTQAEELASIIEKQNNGQTSQKEKEYLKKISQLVTFELGVAKVGSNLSTIGQFAYQTLFVTGIKALTESMILTYDDMLYQQETSMMSEPGYYQIKTRTLGNSGDSTASYDLLISGDYPQNVMTVYRSPNVEEVELGSGSEYRKSYIHNDHITFKKVPAVQNIGGWVTTQEIDYVVEFEYVNTSGLRQFQSCILSSSEIGNKQNGEISLTQLLEKADIKLNAGVVYFVRVRTRGTVDSTLLSENETLLLKSGLASSSRMQILSPATLGIESGELYWSRGASANALGYELEVYPLSSSTDSVVEGTQPTISRRYDARVQQYEDLDADFTEYQLTHGWYAVRIRSLGNGSDYITGAWSNYQTVYRLPNVVGSGDEIILKDGDIAWTPSYIDENVLKDTASKILVFQSSNEQGGYTCRDYRYTIVSNGDKSQRKLVLADIYNKMLNNQTQYYKVAIANIVTDDNQPLDAGYLYLRSDYTMMEQGYSRLDQPTGLRVSEGQIVWDATGTGFEVMISGQALQNEVVIRPTSSNSFSLDLDARFVAGVYEIRVRNVADSVTRYLSSVYSEPLIVTKYKSPDLRLEKGHIVWNTSSITSEEEASIGSIEVSIAEGQQERYHEHYDLDHSYIDLNSITLEGGEPLKSGTVYTISVAYKVGENNTNYLNGEVASMDFTILPSTELYADSKSNEEGVDNYVAWHATHGAKGYIAYIYYKNEEGSYTYLSQDEVSLSDIESNDRFDYDDTQSAFTYKVPRIEGKIYRVYIEAMGDTIATSDRDHQGLVASSLLLNESTYMDIELPACPNVHLEQISKSYNGYISWDNVTESAYPVIEYRYRKKPGEEQSESIVVKLPKNTTYYYLPTIAGEYFVKVYAQNDLGANSDAVSFKTSFTSYNDGDGTQDNPYQISNATQFNAMKERAHLTDWMEQNGRVHFVLTNHITLESSYKTMDTFNAILSGQTNENAVYGVTMPADFTGSLFGTIGEGASVSHLKVTHNLTVSKSSYSLLAQENNGTLSYLDIQLAGTYKVSRFAGVVMQNNGEISHANLSLSAITINPYSASGVLYASMVAEENRGVVEHVTLVGSASLNATTSGEIMMAGVAYTNYNRVSYIHNTALLSVSTGVKDYSSILVGLVANNLATVEFSGVNTTLTGNIIGGLVYNNYATIDNCYFVGSMQATRVSSNSAVPFSIGGLVVNNQDVYFEGMEDRPTTPVITNSYVVMKEGITIGTNVVNIGEGYARIGGLVVNNNVNKAHENATIMNCYVAIHAIHAEISGYHFGLIAYSSTAKNNNYPVFSNVYYYNGISEISLIRYYNGSQHITTSNDPLGFVGVTSYATIDQMTGLRPMYKVTDWCDWVVLDWQTKV